LSVLLYSQHTLISLSSKYLHLQDKELSSSYTYLESEANIAVIANPVGEGSAQNSVVAAHNSNNETLSNITTVQLQDLLATVMTAIQAESSKQTAAFQTELAKLTETLKTQFRQENEKLAASLTEKFEAANTKLREEFNVKLQNEIQCVSERVNILKGDTEHATDNLNKSVDKLSEATS
jgi:DNA anti-recombination protein RmuC